MFLAFRVAMEASIWRKPVVSLEVGTPVQFAYDDYHMVWRTDTDVGYFLATRGLTELDRILDSYIYLLSHELTTMDREIEKLKMELFDSTNKLFDAMQEYITSLVIDAKFMRYGI